MVGWIAIYTEEDLINVREGLNKNFILMADITLTKPWTAIGDSTNQFKGTLEGNYHKIEGLNVNNTGGSYQGLFGYIGEGGKVSNLTLSGTVAGKGYVGMLAGWNNNGTIENIKVSGTVTGSNYYVGGLVGRNNGTNAIIEKCYSEVEVTNTRYSGTGGLVGENSSGTIRKSAASGKVTGYQQTGGLVGNNNGTIENAYSTGEVTGSSGDTGGLVGNHSGGTITNTYSISKVNGVGSTTGGLIGRHYGGSVTNSYWTPEKAGVQTSASGTSIETDALMQVQATYEGFDFTSIWVMKTYPQLNYNFGGK